MGMNRRLATVIFLLICVLWCPPAFGQDEVSAFSQDETSDSGGWEFQVIPYFWAAGLDGDVTINGNQSSVNLSFSEIWDDLDFGGMAHLEARKEKWGLFLDPLYLKLSSEGDLELGPLSADVEVDVEMAAVEFGGFYRLEELPLGDGGTRMLFIDVLAGGRYMHVNSEISIKGRGPLNLTLDVDETQEWVDPFIGLRFRADLTARLFVHVRGDIGGFDLGDSSDVAWNALAVLGYQLTERTAIMAGYRALGVDYDDGSGADLFEFDALMNGPVFGLAISF